MRFKSEFVALRRVTLPEFSGTRVMMMPVILGDSGSVPESLAHYRPTLEQLWRFQRYSGQVGYLTIDEKHLEAGETHRRPGLHVDGVYRGAAGGWGGGAWGSRSTGMLTVASHFGCRAWRQEFEGFPGDEGECEHLSEQCGSPVKFEPFVAYWCGGLCVHESVPQSRPVNRQFVRLSLPSKAPWFEGYTVNPLGVEPTGPILPRREFMNA